MIQQDGGGSDMNDVSVSLHDVCVCVCACPEVVSVVGE